MSTSEGNNNISRPRPLVRRSKSVATALPKSSASVSSSRPDSAASGTSQGSNMSLMQTIVKALNTPIVEPSRSSTPQERSNSNRTSTPSRFLRPEDKLGRNKDLPPIPRMRSASSLKSTTMSLLSDYSVVRSSILSCEGSGRPTEAILQAAKRYYASMKMYLTLVDDLPPSVRDTLEVQRLRQQLAFTVELLQPVMHEAHGTQTILVLDNTLMLVKSILSDVQNLLLQQMHPAFSHHEEDSDGDSLSMAGLYEFDITDMHLQMLISEPEEAEESKPQREGLRRMKSSAAALGSSPSAASLYRGTEINNGRAQSMQRLSVTRSGIQRERLTECSSPTKETLVGTTEEIKSLADALWMIKGHPLFQEANCANPPAERPEDTIDINYGQDGTPIAMSPTAIIEQLVNELNPLPTENEEQSSNFSDIIFTTFRFFWHPQTFVEHLKAEYDDSFYTDRKISIVLLVRTWILAYWLPQDSRADGLIKKIQRFLGKVLADGHVSSSIVIDILSRLEEYATNPDRPAIIRELPEMEYESMPFRLTDISRDLPLIRGNFGNIRTIEFDSSAGCLELARQLTLRESGLYLQLTAQEVISCFVDSGKRDKETAAAHEKMKAMRELGSAVKRWATWNILKRSTPLKRAKAFGFMMRLAKTLLGIRNFSSAHSVYNGALSIHLDILSQTEAEITPKARRNMELVATFFEENKDISMQSSAEPTVPLIATYSGKLSRLLGSKGVMTPSRVKPSVMLVNIAFFKAATRVTYAMENNQNAYEFKAHEPLQRFINYTLENVPDEDGIHDRYVEVKGEEQGDVEKPGLMKRLRKSSMAAFPMFS